MVLTDSTKPVRSMLLMVLNIIDCKLTAAAKNMGGEVISEGNRFRRAGVDKRGIPRGIPGTLLVMRRKVEREKKREGETSYLGAGGWGV